MTKIVTEESKPVLRYAIRRGSLYLATPAASDGMHFSSPTVYDAMKYASPEDAKLMIKHLFEVEPPTKWDGKANSHDPDAPFHLGKFHGEDMSDLEIVATHT